MGQNTDYPPWFQKAGHALRWLLFIPGGFAVGGLIAFVGFFVPALFYELFASSHPDWVEHPLFFTTLWLIILVLPFVVGFSATVYGKRIAPSENKKIPGLIISVSLTLLFLTDFPMKFLVEIMGAELSLVCCAITVLTSLITAFRLKPVKRTALMSDTVYPEHIDPDRVPAEPKPQAEVKKDYYTGLTPYLIFLVVAGSVTGSFVPEPYQLFVLLGAVLISSGIKYWPKIARFFRKSRSENM